MSRSRTVPIKFPQPLVDPERLDRLLAVTKLPNFSALMVNALRYFYLYGGEHYVGAEWANAPRAEQDAIDDEVTRAFDNGESLAGSYFRHLVEDSLKELKVQIEAPEHKVAAIMRRKLVERGMPKPK